jgi:beta-lactamase class A
MKKVRLLPVLLSLCPVLILSTLTFTAWNPLNSKGQPLALQASFLSFSRPDTAAAPATEAPVTYTFDALPLAIPTEAVVPFENLQDSSLQSELESILKSNSRWTALSKNKTLSIGIVDMKDPLHSRFAAINPNNMVYAASLPKIAILLAAQEAIENGKLRETPEVKQDMRLMIAKSSNSAASRMIDRVGIKALNAVLQDPKYKLYDQENGGGLWVGKSYGSAAGRIGDPIKNLSHAASVAQVCKYYYMLAFGQLVTPDRSKEMLNALVNPELHHKFVSVLDRVAPDAKVYRKSGTWSNWHTDSALVWDKDRKYIVVVLAEDQGGEQMLRDLMAKIDTRLVAKG